MDNSRRMIVAFLQILFLTPIGLSAPSAEPLSGDRVILEINSNVYTQRALESYLIFRAALGADKSRSKVDIVANDDWKNALGSFTDEMLILQDAQRAGSFSASGKTIDAALQMIEDSLKSLPKMQTRLNSLRVDAAQRGKIVSWILKVEGFRRSKDRQNADVDPSAANKSKALAKNDWLKELQDRAVVRLFDGASTYRPIYFSESLSK